MLSFSHGEVVCAYVLGLLNAPAHLPYVLGLLDAPVCLHLDPPCLDLGAQNANLGPGLAQIA